jgi:DsbC/DsbD-like thiol-disulfide interchange protein
MRWIPIVPIVAALAGAPADQRAPPASPPHARVTLIADSAVAAPGATIWIGLNFAIESGWHIYWKNPGQAGTPPEAVWHAPAFRMGEFVWPVPERIVSSGDVSYGYGTSATILAPATRTTPARSGALAIAAAVTYVICRDVCVMERASPSISLAAGSSSSASANAPFIAAARARVPAALPAGWHATASLTSSAIVLALHPASPLAAASFFPATPGVIDDAAPPALTRTAAATTIALQKSKFFATAPAFLDGVLATSSAAYVVHAPLSPRGNP